MSDDEFDRLLTEPDPPGMPEEERRWRMAERVRLIAVLMIQIRNSKDKRIDDLDKRLIPLEAQMIGWRAGIALLIGQIGIVVALAAKWMK